MSVTTAGILQAGFLVLLLAAVHKPLGDYMARVYTSTKHFAVERVLYKVMGVDPDAERTVPGCRPETPGRATHR